MESLLFLRDHWFAVALVVVALGVGGCLLLLSRRRAAWFGLLLFGATAGLIGLGDLVGAFFKLPDWLLTVAFCAALGVLFLKVILVVASGHWYAPLAYTLAAVMAVCFGALTLGATTEGLNALGLAFTEFQLTRSVLRDQFPLLLWLIFGSLTILALVLIGLLGLKTWKPLNRWILIGCLCLGVLAYAGLFGFNPMMRGGQLLQVDWLILGFLVPFTVLLGLHSLSGIGPIRRALAIGLSAVGVMLLAVGLAEPRVRSANQQVTTIFLYDVSLSVPQEIDINAPAASPEARKDLRFARVTRFMNDSVEGRNRNSEYKRDMAGLIVFGKRPRLELPPSTAPRFNFTEVQSSVDPNYTDLAAAIKLALASFPEGSGKRIVLVTDGNQNLGNAEEQALLAKRNGVQIDVVPLAAGFRNESEVLVEKVEAPPQTEQGSRLPIRVLVRSYNPLPVVGDLELRKIVDGQVTQVEGSPLLVKVRHGLNPFTFKQTLSKEQKSYTYEAKFTPRGVEVGPDKIVTNIQGDRPQNNRATTHVVALGQRKVLVIEQRDGEQQMLVDYLSRLGESKFKVYSTPAGKVPQEEAELGVYLSNFDCVILANVPAELLTEEQQRMIASNTHDQGCGLIMVGGPDSFGAGGWQGTPIEKALPVDCDIKSLKIQGKGGLVLIMHACEMPDGNKWTKEIAKLAIKKLSPNDEVGIIYWGWGSTMWHIKLQAIGNQRNYLLGQVDKLSTGDMMDFDPALQMALDALTDPQKDLATKHIILISDGDAQQQNKAILQKMKQNKVTCTTVGVATHGASEDTNLTNIATATGGRFHKVTNPRALPAIYIKETRLVSQSFIHEKRFQPTVHFRTGPTDGLPDPVPPLYGFVRTTLKESPLVEMPIEGPPAGDLTFPVLAQWHYGLGKAVAFTSDARTIPDKALGWDREWARSDMYLKFWEQVVDWSLRQVETGRMTMTTDFRDGMVTVTVDARDERNRPLTDLTIRGAVTTPGAKQGEENRIELKFDQKNTGIYEARFKAEDAGSYFINAQARRMITEKRDDKDVTREDVDSIRSGVTIPYSPEFADMESNVALLNSLAEKTGGKVYLDTDDALATAARDLEVFRREGLVRTRSQHPIWFYLVTLAGFCLLANLAVRRIAIDPVEAWATGRNYWDRLRGRTLVMEQTPEFIDRLRSRKAMVGDALTKTKAQRRFDTPEDAPTVQAPPGADEAAAAPTGAPGRRPPATPQVTPDKEEDPADYASRLMKAKKRVWQDKKPDKDA